MPLLAGRVDKKCYRLGRPHIGSVSLCTPCKGFGLIRQEFSKSIQSRQTKLRKVTSYLWTSSHLEINSQTHSLRMSMPVSKALKICEPYLEGRKADESD